MPTERLERLDRQIRRRGSLGSRYAMRVAAWAAVAGIDVEIDTPMSPPHAAMAAARLAQRRPTRSATSAGRTTGR